MRARAVATGSVALSMVAALGIYLGVHHFGERISLPRPASCLVQADGEVTLDPDQMANAATIVAVGVRRQVSEQAVVIALATAFQESRLRNLTGGDRDSIGLFQQRPSQGWGTPEQIRDPRYATDKFYAALRKVRGWEGMKVTEAAQAVQRSAFPGAYEQWADDSAVLARALLGNATGAVACTVDREPVLRGGAAEAALSSMVILDWGQVQTTASAQLPGLALAASDAQVGWRYAHWLVSHADDHGVKRVRFDGLQWTAAAGTWSRVSDGSATNDQVIAEVFSDA